MLEVQKLAIDNIYCAPYQDRKFTFNMVRVNKDTQPFKGKFNVFNIVKNLPDTSNRYHVFMIGNLNPNFLNLLQQDKDWFKDVWIQVSSDMSNRNYILKVYNDNGVMFPRSNIYYSFINESSILIALKLDTSINNVFDNSSFKYLQIYSNAYFNTSEFNTLPVKLGIKYIGNYVYNNVDKVTIQNQISNWKTQGGDIVIYVNGYYTDTLTLNTPNNSFVEVIYDQSIISKEYFQISNLRTFQSVKDNSLKYLLFRNNIINRIQFEDDNELYISNINPVFNIGSFFYQHTDYSVRNVTDKDYSLHTTFVNNLAQTISNLTTGSINDKKIVLYTRKSGLSRPNIYSSLKLNELYKLPQDKELDVLTNNNYTLHELRADTLEDSDYFKVASAGSIQQLTTALCTSAIGYNGLSYYLAKTPIKIDLPVTVPLTLTASVPVPYIYRNNSTVFEYNNLGKYVNKYITNGPVHVTTTENIKYVEFVYGKKPETFGRYYTNQETFNLRHTEYRILSATFNGVSRLTNWVDITDNPLKVSRVGNQITINEDEDKKIKVVYLNEPNIYDIDIDLNTGNLFFPLVILEDRGTGEQLFPIDVPYSNIEIFLNDGNRLTYGLDYFMDFPNISICNKTYLNYSNTLQHLHIRMYGFTLDVTKINSTEVNGFINNGALTRNNVYDIRDDRVYSLYVDGKMYDKSMVVYAEDDNTVRVSSPLNGLPYTISEPFIPLKDATGLDTLPLYLENIDINKKISQLFTTIFNEPTIDPFNVIPTKRILFSPTVSKIVNDIVLGVIPSTLYTTPYNDSDILDLLNTTYRHLLYLDPIKFSLQSNLVEIHPHLGNTPISVNLFAFRFITKVVSLITNGDPSKINLSGYINVTTTT